MNSDNEFDDFPSPPPLLRYSRNSIDYKWLWEYVRATRERATEEFTIYRNVFFNVNHIEHDNALWMLNDIQYNKLMRIQTMMKRPIRRLRERKIALALLRDSIHCDDINKMIVSYL